MSEIKVNKLSPRTNCGTVQLGDSGDTITIPAGATITNNGTAAGFGATGAASWDTTVKTTGFTAVSGVGYFVDTTSGAITVTLPASPSAGDVVAVSDYAGTADTNNITIGRNGSNINGAAADLTIEYENSAITLVYVDSTQGWKATDTSSLSDIALQPTYMIATGGTITEDGDYKIHTFTGPGTFTVTCLPNPLGGPASVDYVIVAGGGGGGSNRGGGAGAGGFREGYNPGSYTASPLATTAMPVSVTGYPIVIGGGGAAGPGTTGPVGDGGQGTNSTAFGLTAAGGAYGRAANVCAGGVTGGSGGGASYYPVGYCGGAGNTPPTSPPQGNPGGNSVAPFVAGGGGGATQAGSNGGTDAFGVGGPGGDGATTNINGSPTAFAGGGGGGSNYCRGVGNPNAGTGGTGGGGAAGNSSPAPGQTPSSVLGTAGTVNTGGGGGGGAGNTPSQPNNASGAGGSGIVIIRYKFQ
jgi:hypothetical protein